MVDVHGSSLTADSQPKLAWSEWLAATHHSVCIHQVNRANFFNGLLLYYY